jgi:hypothetical protein
LCAGHPNPDGYDNAFDHRDVNPKQDADSDCQCHADHHRQRHAEPYGDCDGNRIGDGNAVPYEDPERDSHPFDDA